MGMDIVARSQRHFGAPCIPPARREQRDVDAEAPQRVLASAPRSDGGAVRDADYAHGSSRLGSPVHLDGSAGGSANARATLGSDHARFVHHRADDLPGALIEMADEFRLVTVCTGNVHRSALAAALFRRWADWYLSPDLARSVSIASAGLAAPVGRPMDDRVLKMTLALGADGSRHRAAQLEDSLLSGADLVLVASRSQREKVLQRVPASLLKTFTMREAGRIAERLDTGAVPQSLQEMRLVVDALASRRGSADPWADDIVDPQGRDEYAYLQMARDEVPALARVARVLFGMPRPDVAAYLAAAEDPASLLSSSPGRGQSE
jgi:protein-tyrosine phosphatase